MVSFCDLLVVPVATVVNVAVQLATYRFMPGFGYMKSVFAGFGVGLLLVLAVEAQRLLADSHGAWDLVGLLVGDVTTFGVLGYLFFNFINVGESSIRIRIMRELQAATEPLSEAALLERYNDRIILRTRLARLASNYQVTTVDGRYVLQAKSLVGPAKVMRTLKFLLLGRYSEFERSSRIKV